MAQRKNKVFAKDWLKLHPFEKAASSDSYYQKLCNKVYYTISDIDYEQLSFEFDEEELIELACYLTCYFEDVISQTGIWQAFTSKHFELYGRYLPFYKTDEYYHDEVNPEDIQFLLWYHYSIMYSDIYFEPDDQSFILLAKKVYALFEEEYEFAPENKNLKEFLTIQENETDYYKVRLKMDWIFINSYLFYFHEEDLLNKIDELVESKKNVDNYQFESAAYDMRDMMVINDKSSLLALQGKDWFANIIGKEHKLFKDVLSISERKTGYFLYKGEDESNIILQHIASDKIINLTKKSIDSQPGFEKDSTMFSISIVKWKDEWWFSGSFASFSYIEDLMLDEKNDIQSRALFQDKSEQKLKELNRQHQLFLQFNDNNNIAFFQNGNELNGFINRYIEFTNDSLKLSKKEHDDSDKMAKENGYPRDSSDRRLIPENLEDSDCLVFYNKNSGVEILLGYNDIIPDKKNSAYNAGTEEERLLNLFLSDHCSADFVKYVLNTYPEISAGEDIVKHFSHLISDTDFLLRFYKKNNYYPKPQITMI